MVELKTQNLKLKTQACDLCGESAARFVLETPRLDGPLMRCRGCGLFYVIASLSARVGETNGTPPADREPTESSLAADEMRRLAARAHELALVEPQVEENERHWREMMAAERLADLRRFATDGRLADIG